MKCGLCGSEFDERNAAACRDGCPLSSGCRLVRCPHCSYEMPPEPKWLQKIFKTGTKKK